MFGQFGLLPTSSNRLFLVFTLKWMARNTFHNANIIRKIRNSFAHDIQCDNFGNTKVKGLLASLQPTHRDPLIAGIDAYNKHNPETESAYIDKDLVLYEYDRKDRMFFILESIFAINKVIRDLCVLPEAEKFRVCPDDLVKDFEAMPGNLRTVHLKVTGSMIRTITEMIGTQQ